MATISSAEARQHLSELISRTAYGKERIVLTRRGKGIVALVPVEDLDLLERIENLIDIAESDKALADV
ncbi:MAG: type II toxin-antitoxin system prevent-host-death family antitoxin, partial [Dehalococcoidia bacterium]|nr:type II toxin-antitoxin system prevent-host-death family antitoxin [Dehalococcoidia bacterium]